MVSELTHAAWNTLETLNNLEKYLETFALLSNHSVLMLSLPEISEMLAMNTGSSGDAEIFKQRNWPKEVVHNFFIQIACLLCGWTAPWICIIKQSTVLAGLTGTETANHCRSWQYKRPLTNGRNRKKTIFQPVHHKHSLSSEQAGSSDFPAFILHWGSRPQARQQEFLVTGALGEQAGQQGSVSVSPESPVLQCHRLCFTSRAAAVGRISIDQLQLTCKNPYHYFAGCLQGGKWHQEQMVRG